MIPYGRSEAYSDGFAEGYRFAESDIRDGMDDSGQWRAEAWLSLAGRHISEPADRLAAFDLGRARGYRECVARYEAGTYTRQMFDTVAP